MPTVKTVDDDLVSVGSTGSELEALHHDKDVVFFCLSNKHCRKLHNPNR